MAKLGQRIAVKGTLLYAIPDPQRTNGGHGVRCDDCTLNPGTPRRSAMETSTCLMVHNEAGCSDFKPTGPDTPIIWVPVERFVEWRLTCGTP